ncbi:hypothetical protein GGR58DRAFT_507417 [Xylaria digitata]|nr:hypothetical protein GGR58DRAFT_507417 [Xylaria digitata]
MAARIIVGALAMAVLAVGIPQKGSHAYGHIAAPHTVQSDPALIGRSFEKTDVQSKMEPIAIPFPPHTGHCCCQCPSPRTTTTTSTKASKTHSTTLSTTRSTTTTPKTTSKTTTSTTTSSPPSNPTAPCDQRGYLVQGSSLYLVNFITGQRTLLGNSAGVQVNAMGYNLIDSYLYASSFAGIAPTLVKIGGTGNSEPVAQLPLPASGQNWNMGEVVDGVYWASNNGNSYISVDVTPSSATYGQVISSGTASTMGYTPLDWVSVPGSGCLYALGFPADHSTTQLMCFSLDSHTWSLVKNLGSVAGTNSWPALYFGSSTTFAATEYTSGGNWGFDLLTNGTPFPLSPGLVLVNSSDGARCPNASPILPPVNDQRIGKVGGGKILNVI